MIPRSLLIGVAVLLAVVVTMGIYLRHMRRQAGELASPAASALPVPPPATGPTETVTLYVADDAAGILRPRSTQIPLPGGRQQRAEELLRALLRIYQQPGSAHPLAPASDIRSIYLVDPGAAVIDLNGLLPVVLASLVVFALAWCTVRGTALAFTARGTA